MIRRWAFVSISLAGVLAGCGSTSKSNDRVPPPCRPVRDLLMACRTGDLTLFKSAYSERMRLQFDGREGGWPRYFASISEILGKDFGAYSQDDFELSFQGDLRKGKVRIGFKGRERASGDLYVLLETDGWKVDEQ